MNLFPNFPLAVASGDGDSIQQDPRKFPLRSFPGPDKNWGFWAKRPWSDPDKMGGKWASGHFRLSGQGQEQSR
ncbi:hypothetical protein M378DRAFT_162343 [Amanita muscaria Koide BX008]|uniref:Uncharacterized protein n=1 Tax=Amanita muscaria (strain Koide BX008) TaxID=946122 RepID=A0A0C2X8L8_AMAMK|nr:hypothetical protein M378DRAFT_162343 [Amanita muscaria Koide BX008]